MIKSESKKNFKALLALLVALTMAFVLAFSVSCGGDGSDSDTDADTSSDSDTEETVTDTQVIANGDFEFYTTSSTSYPYSSSIKWTKSTDKGVDSAPSSTASSGIIDTTDEAFTALSDSDKPATNPGTPFDADCENTASNEGGKKILMIHNKVSDSDKGSAQYFTNSETITLSYDKIAKLSVWVKTAELTTKNETAGFNDYGAYIKILNTVDSSIQPLLIKSINTDGKWVNYVIYLEPSNFAVTKYKVVLGLGRGDKSNAEELCEGYAFFDNVEYSIVESDEDKTAMSAVSATDTLSLYDNTNANVLDKYLDKNDLAVTANPFVKSEAGKIYTDKQVVNYKLTFKKAETDLAVSGSGDYNQVLQSGNVSEGTVTITTDKVNIEFNAGSSYTYTLNLPNDKIGVKDKYYKVSLIANVKAMAYQTKASIVLVDGNNDSSTGTFSNFDTNGEDVRYTLYISSKLDDVTAKLKLSFGPTEKTTDISVLDLPTGHAYFSDFTYVELTEDEYNSADTSNDTHAVKVSLKGENLNGYSEEDEDDEYEDIKEDYAFSITNAYYDKISKEPLPLTDFTSSYKQVGGTDDTVVGLINSKFKANYGYAVINDALTALENGTKNKYVQPILIYNNTATATGIIGNRTTVSANTSYKFEVKLKVVGDATANVYLVDMSGDAPNYDGTATKTANYSVYSYSVSDKVTGGSFESNVTKDTEVGPDGYVTVTFYVTAGESPLYLRTEVWNGTRANGNSTGYVLVGEISAESGEYASFDDVKENYSAVFTTETYNQGKIYSYYNGDESDPVLDDDNEKVYKVADDYVVYATNANGTVKFMRADVLNKSVSVEKTDEEEETSSEEEESSSDEETTIGNLVWLQITSIIIAGVLVIVLVVIVLRKVFEGKAKKKEKTRSYYVGYDKKNRVLPKVKDIEAPDDTDEEYDYGDGETDK